VSATVERLNITSSQLYIDLSTNKQDCEWTE